MACYYHYCALLRRSYRGKSGRRCYYLLREDFSKFNRYRRQCDLLWEQKSNPPRNCGPTRQG